MNDFTMGYMRGYKDAQKEALSSPNGEAQPAVTESHKQRSVSEQQEPVEWGVDWGPDGNSVSIIKRLAGGGIEVVGWEYAPHPPQRTTAEGEDTRRAWVGLTDEDRQEAFESMPDMLDGFLKKWGWLHFSKAIEAKLKEKNT